MESDAFTYLRAFFALAFVAGLIVLLAAVAKKTGLDRKLAGNQGADRKLSVSETLYLDPKRRLVLIKCDGREHLLLLGAAGDLLIESHADGEQA